MTEAASRKPQRPAKPTRKVAVKRETYRDQLRVPTAKEVEESISRGKSRTLDAFVKGVKL